jgi:hypothetical protein
VLLIITSDKIYQEPKSTYLELVADGTVTVTTNEIASADIHPHELPTTTTFNLRGTHLFDGINAYFDYKPSFYIKCWIYYDKLAKFKSIAGFYDVQESTDIFKADRSTYRKAVAFKLHPDKGGNDQAFKLAEDLYEKFHSDIDKELLFNKINNFLYKSAITVKGLDITVDLFRMVDLPTPDNIGNFIFGSIHLYSMYHGNNNFLLFTSVVAVPYDFYQGDYLGAIGKIALATTPSVLAFAHPIVGFVYTATLTLYSLYSVYDNARSFLGEYFDESHQEKSQTARLALYETIDDFYNTIFGEQENNSEKFVAQGDEL